MQARDATGRQVSLLNDDPYASHQAAYPSPRHYAVPAEQSPLPLTPKLLRSNSYDSTTSYDGLSPLTPGIYDYASRPMYEDYMSEKHHALKRPAYVATSRSNSFEDDSSNASSGHEKPTKRYPCRYRDTHGCEKTFTTSGHASRHSKIHTAEKAVQCTFPGCHKKFTRADNMKQHLETHFKDKSRSSSSSKTKSASLSSSKRNSISSKTSMLPSTSQASPDVHMWDAVQYAERQLSPTSGWDMRGLNLPIMNRPTAIRTSSGLDALAEIACQEGA
ncbi:hypothetical protein F5Y15DRAFT_77547 [Xylariaceae sp. FL0016]|nr:hypothetical protein F5Y15DRAFT_77547 [Xylariaceae sp. FL0016]